MLGSILRFLFGKQEAGQSPAPSPEAKQAPQDTAHRLFKGKQYVSVLDNYCCPECWPLDGMKFDLDDKNIPSLPRHDGCRCLLMPIVKTWRDFGIDLDELERPTKRRWKIHRYHVDSYKSGYVDGTAEDWIRTLDEDEQGTFFPSDLAYELWKAGKIKGIDLLDPKTWELRSDDELRALVGTENDQEGK